MQTTQPEIGPVVTNIYGAVTNSTVLVAGRDLVTGDLKSATRPQAAQQERVLFCQADYEILEGSGVLRGHLSDVQIYNMLVAELRILLLAISSEGCVIIPPTYFLEFPLCRQLLQAHQPFVQAGYIRLVSDYASLDDYLEVKRERYSRAARYARYREAYFAGTDYGLVALCFRPASKAVSVGSVSIGLWSTSLREQSERLGYPIRPIEVLIERASETQQNAFLYETLLEDVASVGIAPREATLLRIRQIKNHAYLSAYKRIGVVVPSGSALVSDILAPPGPRSPFDILAWRRIYESCGVLGRVCSVDSQRLLVMKADPEITTVILSIRERLAAGDPTDAIIVDLFRAGSLRVLEMRLREAQA